MPLPLVFVAVSGAVLLTPLIPAEPPQDPAAAGGAPVERQWLDAQGDPLAPRTDEEMEEVLRRAPVKGIEGISRGVAGAQKLILQDGDVEISAVFRTVAMEQRERRLGNRVVFFFRDHYIHEPAAYALSELLGLEMVPPAVVRTVRGRPGSVQIWVEGARAAVDRKDEDPGPPDERAMMLQYYQMQVFDNLINNLDRNQGNILVDPHWRVWLIDHTQAFVRDQQLSSPDTVRRVERGLWARLRTVSDAELDAAVDAYLPGPERGALLVRRRLLVELLQEKIDLLGEDGVLFDRADLQVRD